MTSGSHGYARGIAYVGDSSVIYAQTFSTIAQGLGVEGERARLVRHLHVVRGVLT